MIKEKLTGEQKRLDVDLWLIAIISIATLMLYIVFNNHIIAVLKNNSIHVLLRVLLGATFQFGIAGLGIVVVSVFRKESFFSHGLRKKGIALSIILCVACFFPNIVFSFATKQVLSYLPFQSVWTTKDIIASGFPTNIIGMLITTIVWGFFEGFNYVVVSDKINGRYPSNNKWLNWGAISCGILCILIHGAIGVSIENIIETLTIFFLIYGMLIVKEQTGNAWGCITIFMLLWNAF